MSDSDFKQDIQPAGLPRKRYPFRKPHAAMGHGGTRSGPGGARQVGRAPKVVQTQRQLSVQNPIEILDLIPQ